MRRLSVTLLFCLIIAAAIAQPTEGIINEKEVKRIEAALSADDMNGRKAFTKGGEKAADFISGEFRKSGLVGWNGAHNYKQTFGLITPKLISVSASSGGISIDPTRLIIFTCQPHLTITSRSGFKKIHLEQILDFRKEEGELLKLQENVIVFVDSNLVNNFSRLSRRDKYLFKSDKSVVFVLGSFATDSFAINVKHKITESIGSNVVGVLPGKSNKEESVIFSAHYDHLGIGKAKNNDSVYNGANDNASGVAAVILLAKYYKAAKNNERTLIFAAFTAEEIGGYGSQYFSRQADSEKVIAMLNIEMIGTESKWGKGSAFITGFEKSDMGKILQKNLEKTGFNFYPDPYPEQDLFYRSDNATLARLGVPAHTISTSKMDDEQNYHKPSDEIGTIDIKNMKQIIKSIAISAKSIVAGVDTPTRVKVDQLER